MKIKPNYKDLGYSDRMGPKLKMLVENQLIEDLKYYGIENQILKFDWSNSCIEGKATDYLDGSIDCFSGIGVFDNNDDLVAVGWMEFIHEDNFFLVYWNFLSILKYDENKKIYIDIFEKDYGMPEHILDKIPNNIKLKISNKSEEFK